MIKVNDVRFQMQLKEIKSLIEGIIRTGEQVLDTGHHKKIIKVDCVRVHLQEIKSLTEGIVRTGNKC